MIKFIKVNSMNYDDLTSRSDFLEIRTIDYRNCKFQFALFGTKENLKKMDNDNL